MKFLTQRQKERKPFVVHPSVQPIATMCGQISTQCPQANLALIPDLYKTQQDAQTYWVIERDGQWQIVDGFQLPNFDIAFASQGQVVALTKRLEKAQVDQIWCRSVLWSLQVLNLQYADHNFDVIQSSVPEHIAQMLFGRKKISKQCLCDLFGRDKSMLVKQRGKSPVNFHQNPIG